MFDDPRLNKYQPILIIRDDAKFVTVSWKGQSTIKIPKVVWDVLVQSIKIHELETLTVAGHLALNRRQ